jgi:hypothetical protein
MTMTPGEIMDAEMYITRRMKDHGVTLEPESAIFAGRTESPIRRERIRSAILGHGLGMTIISERKGSTTTYAAAFLKLYGEPLIPAKQEDAA